jgi:hypothetical protein
VRIVFEASRQDAEIGPVSRPRSARAASTQRDVGEPWDRPRLDLSLADWESEDFAFYDFDRRVEALAAAAPGGAFEIRLSGEAGRLPRAARQLAIRCQRLGGWRNGAALVAGGLFDRVLAGHRRLHDLTRPPVLADYAHALDTWQWLLRLDPEASLAVQLAALFHDIERLVSEAGARVERRAAAGGYQAFKDEHARRGALLTDELLAEIGADLATRVQVYRLIAGHERPPAGASPAASELALLNDADVLSFVSLNSPGYLGTFGAELTARKIAWSLARIRPAARARLRELRLSATVARLLDGELARPGSAGAGGEATAGAGAGAVTASDGAAAVGTAEGAGSAAAAGDARVPMQPAGAGVPPRNVDGPFFRGKPGRAAVRARSRLAAGLAGGAGIARTRVGALLARAAAMGTLQPRPSRARGGALGPRAVTPAGAGPGKLLGGGSAAGTGGPTGGSGPLAPPAACGGA